MAAFDSVRFTSGRPLLGEISADKLNAILAEIRKNRPRGERGITVRQSGDATYIGLAASTGTGGGATESHPFQISASIDDEGAGTLTVQPGTLNSLLPSNIFEDGALNEFGFSGGGTIYVILTGISDGNQFTECSVSVGDQAPEAQTPLPFGLPTEAKFLLGVAYNNSVYQVQKTNIVATGKQQFIKQKPSPASPGEMPYEIYYVWG
jgi:hypothetical protein